MIRYEVFFFSVVVFFVVRRYVVLLHKVQMLIHEILELVVVDVYTQNSLRNINTSGKVCSVRFCV